MEFYERIIEEFGGYEKCKEILSQPNIDFIMNAGALRGHLLRYRRANNIFEEGDNVVFTNKRYSPKVCKWAHKTNWRPNYALLDRGNGYLEPFKNSDIRHATDEEIAAGHRL